MVALLLGERIVGERHVDISLATGSEWDGQRSKLSENVAWRMLGAAQSPPQRGVPLIAGEP